jgi:hypothetical protein
MEEFSGDPKDPKDPNSHPNMVHLDPTCPICPRKREENTHRWFTMVHLDVGTC